ncbi:hypothetical protein K438DRAFT_1969948 [Mycena galopus ATCC 62051]|nr:hypothetical protein K438DRAFT_1969948 [Mycena galopus ATCC 62051]
MRKANVHLHGSSFYAFHTPQRLLHLLRRPHARIDRAPHRGLQPVHDIHVDHLIELAMLVNIPKTASRRRRTPGAQLGARRRTRGEDALVASHRACRCWCGRLFADWISECDTSNFNGHDLSAMTTSGVLGRAENIRKRDCDRGLLVIQGIATETMMVLSPKSPMPTFTYSSLPFARSAFLPSSVSSRKITPHLLDAQARDARVSARNISPSSSASISLKSSFE